MKYVYVYVLRKYPFWNVQLPLGSSGQDLDGASARTECSKVGRSPRTPLNVVETNKEQHIHGLEELGFGEDKM